VNVEIDQSGKFENTQISTYLAVANTEFSFVLKISAKEKRLVFSHLKKIRPQWTKPMASIQVFGLLLFLLIKKHVQKFDSINIDHEYPGHEAVIKNKLLTLLKDNHYPIYSEQIGFKYVGKQSPAHHKSNLAFKKQEKPNICLQSSEIIQFVSHKK
jgi:hypothetical protein